MPLDTSKLEKIKPRGGKITARCPACAEGDGDRDGAHLLIAEDGKFGCVLFPGTEGAEHRKRIFALIGKPEGGPAPSGPIGTKPTPKAFPTLAAAARHFARTLSMSETRRDIYQDGEGREHLCVVRFDGDGKKQFRPFHKNCVGWLVGDPAGALPLFNLPTLLADSSRPVFVCEGEKAACALAGIDLLTTTSAHGAKSAAKTDWTPLAGREVVILPDNDDEGRAYARDVAGILGRLSPATSVRVVELPDVPPKGDAVEWLASRDAQLPEDLRAELDRLASDTPFAERADENDLDHAPPPVSPISSINGKPALQLPGAGRPTGEFAEECGIALAGKNIFARKGCAFTLDAEGQKLEPATSTWLRSWAEKHVCCYKAHAANGQEMRLASTMTEDTAKVVLQAPQFLEQLRRVERFHPCRMPIIREDGRLELLPEGHDGESATYTVPGSPYPLQMSVKEARELIEQAFAEFPFAADAGRSKAVAIAAVLTVYAGGLMPEGSTRPVFLYLGNAEGTGKTTAARLAGIPYGAVAAEPAPTDEAEWQKKLLSAVVGGRRLILLDNLKGFLNSPSLEAYTTASRYSGRILGVSREFEGEACATVLVTGNRLTISPDMRRRALMVELFMHELRAEDRHFARRLDDPALIELRPRLLAACWALVRSWDDAGRPGSSRMNSSFPRWCDVIGGIVEHAGFACPTAPAEIGGMGDTDTTDIAKLAGEIVTGTRYTFAELAALCAEHGLFERFINDREKDGELTRSAKSTFAKVLKQYDRRSIAHGMKFYIDGQGHARRYIAK